MSKRYWGYFVAVGLIVLCSSGQAQDQSDQTNGSANQQQAPSDNSFTPIPIYVIEDQATADARERHEEEARQREISDLIAQEGMNAATQAMNEATQRMADYAWWSTFLVGIGTALLFVTLWLTRQANVAAQLAVRETRRIGEAQVRAYVAWHSCEVATVVSENHGATEIVQFAFRPQIQNTGQSPATLIDLYADFSIFDSGVTPTVSIDAAKSKTKDIIGAGNTFGMARQSMTFQEAISIYQGIKSAYLTGWGRYFDIFQDDKKTPYTFSFCFKMNFMLHPSTTSGTASDLIDLHSMSEYMINIEHDWSDDHQKDNQSLEMKRFNFFKRAKPLSKSYDRLLKRFKLLI